MIFHVTRYAHQTCDLWAAGGAAETPYVFRACVFHVVVSRYLNAPDVVGDDLYLEGGFSLHKDTFAIIDIADLPDDILAKLMEFQLCHS